MKRLALSLVMSLTCVAFLAPNAFSDTITFAGTQYNNGTGIGNTLNVLSLQGNPSEAGSNTPSGGTTTDVKSDSHTYTSAFLSTKGLSATNFGLVFNPNETGSGAPDTLDVLSFSLDFWNGTTLMGSTSLTGAFPINIVPISTGTGSSGWLMVYNNAAGTGLLDQFFANPTWVLGASGSINNTDDGPDNFYLINPQIPPPPVPEPSALLLLGSGLVGLAVYGRKAFKR